MSGNEDQNGRLANISALIDAFAKEHSYDGLAAIIKRREESPVSMSNKPRLVGPTIKR